MSQALIGMKRRPERTFGTKSAKTNDWISSHFWQFRCALLAARKP